MSENWDDLPRLVAGTRFGDVRHVEETGSTNDDLATLARDGAPEGVVVVADAQRAGRGRLGRTWVAPPGSSLLLSILVRPTLPLDEVPVVTMALGIAAAEACRAVGAEPRLKWPNDLVLDDGMKLSGMLAEVVPAADGPAGVVLGIGINANWPDDLPAELASIATSLDRLVGQPVSRTALLVLLLHRFDHWYAVAADTSRRGELLGRYRELSATIGRRVRVELGGGEQLTGDAIDVTADGHLLVVDECPDRPREVLAGDVVHVRPAVVD